MLSVRTRTTHQHVASTRRSDPRRALRGERRTAAPAAPLLVVDAALRAIVARDPLRTSLGLDETALPVPLVDVLDDVLARQLLPAVALALAGDRRVFTLPEPSPLTVEIGPYGRDDRDSPLVAIRAAAPQHRLPPEAVDERLMIHTLGATRLTFAGRDVGGRWLEQRPGQLLKLLVTHRGQFVPAERIGEALWLGADARVLANVRFTVHQLRKRIGEQGELGSAVVSQRGGYRLDPARVRCDADLFETLVGSGLREVRAGDTAAAERHLTGAVQLYGGEYLTDEPYADWAFAERERLCELAGRALATLARLAEGRGDLSGATAHLERLARLEPYDEDTHRRLIGLCLRRGRRSEGMRRYAMLEGLLRRDLGTVPSFSLATLLTETS